MNIVPEHDLLYVSLEECREVAAVGEVALVAVLLQHQTSQECLKGFENISSLSQLRWPRTLKAYSRVWNKRTPLNKRSPLENLAKRIIVAPFLPYTMKSGIRP